MHRTDADFPVAWVKTYGAGRVFYSSLGHEAGLWDGAPVSQMYFQALRFRHLITLFGEFGRLTARGVAFTRRPVDAGPVTFAVFADTSGNLIQLYQRASTAKAS